MAETLLRLSCFSVTHLKAVVAGEQNHRARPCFHERLRWVFPHLRPLTLFVILDKDLKMSVLCANIMVETQLQSETIEKRNDETVSASLTKL